MTHRIVSMIVAFAFFMAALIGACLVSAEWGIETYGAIAQAKTGDLNGYMYLPLIVGQPPASNPRPLLVRGQAVRIDAVAEKGFFWPYLIYIPPSVQSSHLLVIPNNTGSRDNDFSVHENRAWNTLNSRKWWADSLASPFLVPIFPRFDDETDGTISSQYLGRGTLEMEWQQRYPLLARQDVQFTAMIDDSLEQLKLIGIDLDKKVLMWGYSASGIFTSRYIVLHPDRVHAAAYGGHGWSIAPVNMWEGVPLPYPYGTGDLSELTGQVFNFADFRKVHIYSYMGAEDVNGWALPWYIGSSNPSTYYDEFSAHFGSIATRLSESAQNIYRAKDCTAEFIIYPGEGHAISSETEEDILEFLSMYKQ